ncbi:MAG: hypothetical protein LAT56_00235 [Wenzhouxiangella sp.]|nr:hypothetical protein [Wenzhouxiangella sp.]
MVDLPEDVRQSVELFIQDSKDKRGGYAHIEIAKPKRPRTTGYRSQNSRFRGHCEDLANQITEPDGTPVYTADMIALALKRMASEEGYPWRLGIDGVREPHSTSEVTLEEMKILLDVQQRYADEHSFYLTEYDEEGLSYRSVGGRSREEMQKL